MLQRASGSEACNYVVVALVTWSKLNLSPAASSSKAALPRVLAGLSKLALTEILRQAHYDCSGLELLQLPFGRAHVGHWPQISTLSLLERTAGARDVERHWPALFPSKRGEDLPQLQSSPLLFSLSSFIRHLCHPLLSLQSHLFRPEPIDRVFATP